MSRLLTILLCLSLSLFGLTQTSARVVNALPVSEMSCCAAAATDFCQVCTDTANHCAPCAPHSGPAFPVALTEALRLVHPPQARDFVQVSESYTGRVEQPAVPPPRV